MDYGPVSSDDDELEIVNKVLGVRPRLGATYILFQTMLNRDSSNYVWMYINCYLYIRALL